MRAVKTQDVYTNATAALYTLHVMQPYERTRNMTDNKLRLFSRPHR
jgi:hypothetical protein